MDKKGSTPLAAIFLGIECGGTRTVAVAVNGTGQVVQRIEAGPANLRLVTDAQLAVHLRQFGGRTPLPVAMAVGMAGARTESDKNRIRKAAGRIWPGVPCYAADDLETALMAVVDRPRVGAKVLILSGTGSCCFGQSAAGKTAKVGGWGHILGDKGSAYDIGLRALKAVVYYYDHNGAWSGLGQRLLRKLQLNEPDDLIGWVKSASKDNIAMLAVEVFNAWADRDRIATDIIDGAAHSLAKDGVDCARRLAKGSVQFVLAGGVLLKQPRFAGKVARLLLRARSGAIVTPLERESVWGAVELAKRQIHMSGLTLHARERISSINKSRPDKLPLPSLESLQRSPTEQRHPRSINLDRLSIAEAIVLMLGEDQKIPPAILAERKKLERAVGFIVRAFGRGGRLFYVGAGTSGRLGVLDASECPPSFRTPPDRVQGIIAGGQRALWEAVEGAEDDPAAGARAMGFRKVNRHDVVVGIAASGRTPFVWGALWEARARGAKTILLCFNPRLAVPPGNRPHLVIAPDVGPEILTGSTRLKAGTATKLVLNIFSTLAMVRSGKVISNLMVDLNPNNVKLRDRAVRILRELTGVDEDTARVALERTGWVLTAAWGRLR